MGRSKQPERDPKRAIVVTRVSTDEQGGSLVGQRDEIHRYAVANGIHVEREFEDKESGRDDERPGLRAAVAYLREPSCKAGTMLVLHTSRLMRDALKFLLLRRRLSELGVRIIATQHNFGDDPVGRLLEQFMAGVAEMESAENARRTRSGMRSAALRGSCPAAVAPLGYRVAVTEGKRTLVPDEGEATTIRLAFEMYSRRGAVQTATELNARRLQLREAPWTRERVLRVIADTAYVGRFVWGRNAAEPVVLPVEPIVSSEIFTLVQRERARRDPVRGSARQGASPLLLGGGLTRCGHCGAAFQLQTSGKKAPDGRRREYMQCSRARRSGVAACKSRPISVPKLDALVTEALVSAMCSPERCQTMLEALLANDGPVAKQLAAEAVRREREIQQLERAKSNLVRAVEEGTSVSALGDRLKDVCARLAAAQAAAQQPQLSRRSGALTDPTFLEAFRISVARRLRADRETCRALLRGLVEAVVVDAERIRILAKADEQRRSA